MDLRIGTSGWDYADWVGPFYPRSGGARLTLYSRLFNTTEVNSTFYQILDAETLAGMARVTPEGFDFSVKMLRDVTHRKRLRLDRGIKADLELFFDSLEPLRSAGKLGPILVQLPPSFRAKPDRLEHLLSLAPEWATLALEFRHPSWDDPRVLRMMESAGAAYVVSDWGGAPPRAVVTSDVGYFRWHGRGEKVPYNYLYSEDELRPWARAVEEAASSAKRVYGYFNNHYHAYAPENAILMLKILGAADSRQEEALKRIRAWREEIASRAPTSLEGFIGGPQVREEVPRGREEVLGLLRSITDERRLERAIEMPASQVEVLTDRGDILMARVRGYDVTIDLRQGVILHDCADWSRQSQKKMFCKHLAALFLNLPPERARRLLRQIIRERDKITFRPFTGDGRRW